MSNLTTSRLNPFAPVAPRPSGNPVQTLVMKDPAPPLATALTPTQDAEITPQDGFSQHTDKPAPASSSPLLDVGPAPTLGPVSRLGQGEAGSRMLPGSVRFTRPALLGALQERLSLLPDRSFYQETLPLAQTLRLSMGLQPPTTLPGTAEEPTVIAALPASDPGFDPTPVQARLTATLTGLQGQSGIKASALLARPSTLTLPAGHQQLAHQQQAALQQLDALLSEVAALPPEAQKTLAPEIDQLLKARAAVDVVQRLNTTLGQDATHEKALRFRNNNVNANELQQLRQLQGELEVLMPALAGHPLEGEVKAALTSLQGTTLALGNPEYIAAKEIQKLDLLPSSTVWRSEIHSDMVAQDRRRDVDATPQGFMMAKILERRYDSQMAGILTESLNKLEALPRQDFDAQAAALRKQLAKRVAPNVVGNDEYRAAILSTFDARVLSLKVKHQQPQVSEALNKVSHQFTGLRLDYQDDLGDPYAQALVATQDRSVAPNLKIGMPEQARIPVARFQDIDGQVSEVKCYVGEEKALLSESDHLSRVGQTYGKDQPQGSAVAQALRGQNQRTQLTNIDLQAQLGRLDQSSAQLGTAAVRGQTQMWNSHLDLADATYVNNLHNKMDDAPEGTPLHQLGRYYKALEIANDPSSDMAKRVDKDKVMAEIERLSQDPQVLKAFADVKAQLITGMFGGPQAAQDLAAHLRSPSFQAELAQLSPEGRQAEVKNLVERLYFLNPDLATEVSNEMRGQLIADNASAIISALSPADKEKAMLEVIKNLSSEADWYLDKPGKGLSAASGKVYEDALSTMADQKLARFEHLLTAADQQIFAKALSSGEFEKLFKDSDALERQLTAFGARPDAIKRLQGPIRWLADNAEKFGALTALVGVGGALGPESTADYLNLASKGMGLAGESAKLLGKCSSLADSKLLKLGGEFLGPAGDIFGAVSDGMKSYQDFKDGDYIGGVSKGVGAAAGGVGAVYGIAIAAGCSGPGAPLVLAGAVVVGVVAWICDETMGEDEKETLLRQLDVLKPAPAAPVESLPYNWQNTYPRGDKF